MAIDSMLAAAEAAYNAARMRGDHKAAEAIRQRIERLAA